MTEQKYASIYLHMYKYFIYLSINLSIYLFIYHFFYIKEEAEARQLGIEILKPGDRAELVTGVSGSKKTTPCKQYSIQNKLNIL